MAEAVNKAIEALDDTENLVPLLMTVGKSHVKRNVTPEHFLVSTIRVCTLHTLICDAIHEKIPIVGQHLFE